MAKSFLGRYELLQKLAVGGMAEIYLARQWGDAGFSRRVVIKRLLAHLSEDPRTLRMFQYEAHLLSALCHPNIPYVLDLAYADGAWFIAMEHVEGHTVSELFDACVRRRASPPVEVALSIVHQAAEALHHAHERADPQGGPLRIVHRDVTPQNLMLNRVGVVKVMDFGVAQTAARNDSEVGAVKGTFSYMAPEQIRAKSLDKRADVFSLGVVLYEASTWTRLFEGPDIHVMTRIVEDDVPHPSSRVAGYPPELERIVMQALSRDRGDRFPSAAHLSQAIEGFASRHQLPLGPRVVAQCMRGLWAAERPNRVTRELPLVEQAQFEKRAAENVQPTDAHEIPVTVEESTAEDLDRMALPLPDLPIDDVDLSLLEATTDPSKQLPASVTHTRPHRGSEEEEVTDRSRSSDYLSELEERLRTIKR